MFQGTLVIMALKFRDDQSTNSAFQLLFNPSGERVGIEDDRLIFNIWDGAHSLERAVSADTFQKCKLVTETISTLSSFIVFMGHGKLSQTEIPTIAGLCALQFDGAECNKCKNLFV